MTKLLRLKKAAIRAAFSCFICCLLASTNALATTYTFTGDGDWNVPGNWDANGIGPGTITSGDSIIIDPSGFCQLTSDLIIEAGGTFTINPSKDFRTGNNDITNSGTFNMLGDINSDGGFDLTNTSTGLINKNGTVFVNGSLNNAGTIVDIGGTWFITGTGGTNTGSIQLNYNSEINIYSGRVFNNDGLLEINSPASAKNSGTFINNDTLRINGNFENGDMMESGIFTNNGTIQITGIFSNGSMYNPSTFTNNGTLKGTGEFKQNGTFNNTSNSIFAPGASPGKLRVSGSIELGDATYSCEINGTAQGTDYDWLDVSDTVTIGGSTKLDILFGYNAVLGDSFDILTASSVSGSFEFPDNVSFSGGNVTGIEVSYLADTLVRVTVSAMVPVPTTYTFTGNGDWNNMANWDGAMPTSTILTGDTVIINASDECYLSSNLIFEEGSTLIVYPGKYFTVGNYDINNSGTFENHGDINSDGDFNLTNNATGLIINQGTIFAHGKIDNAGTIQGNGRWFVSGAGNISTGTIHINSDGEFSLEGGNYFDNSGVFEINSSATLNNMGTFTNNDTVLINGTLSNGGMYGPPSSHLINNGTLKGTGEFQQNGIFTNNSTGILAPGASPGKLTVPGDIDLGAGTYSCEINGPAQGTDYDWLDVSGTATLGDSSRLDIVFGYMPTVGDSFDILTASTVDGSFDFPTNVSFSGGDVTGIELSYPGNSLIRVTVSALVPVPITYTFSGEGDWNNPANWGGGMPPSSILTGDTIIINPNQECYLSSDLIFEEGSTLIVYPGKYFTVGNYDINNSGTFENHGDINSNGDFNLTNNATGLIINQGTIFAHGKIDNDGTIQGNGRWYVSGAGNISTGTIQINSDGEFNLEGGNAFNNRGLFKIDSAAALNNMGTFTNDFTLHINGTLSNGDMYDPSGQLINNGTLKGTGEFQQNGSFTNSSTGVLAPGASPGKLTVSGDLDLGDGTYRCEINGPDQGTDYDWLDVSGTVTIGPDSKLEVVFGVGYAPIVGTSFFIITAPDVIGSFSPANISFSSDVIGSIGVSNPGDNMVRVEISGLLPIELVSFTAKEQDNQVLLHWATASEQNNRGFEVQRSNDGVNWEALGFVAGNGTATDAHHYSYLDKKPLLGINYYRLQQIDFDDKAAYSPVTTVHIKQTSNNGISLYPNPAKGDITLEFMTGYKGEATIILFSPTGKQISAQSFILDGSAVYSNIELPALPSGVYLMDIQFGDERWQERLLIE